jgi:hypothetical protein
LRRLLPGPWGLGNRSDFNGERNLATPQSSYLS